MKKMKSYIIIGGCDIVKEMFETGELSQLLSEKEIPHKSKD